MENKEKYIEIFTNLFNVGEDKLNEEFTSANVKEWDSIMHLSLVTEIEDAFNVMFETEDILRLSSYYSGIEILKEYKVELK